MSRGGPSWLEEVMSRGDIDMDNSIYWRTLPGRRVWLLGQEEACPLGNKRPLAGNLLCLLAYHVGLCPGSRIRPIGAEVDVTAAALEVVQHGSRSKLMECRVLFLEDGDRDGERLGGIVVGRDLDVDTFYVLGFAD
jgi:hypothetical protein